MAIPDKYKHIDFTPNKSTQEAARRGLELRRKQKPSDKGGLSAQEASEQGVGSGVQRAVNMSNGDELSPETWRQVFAFFARFADLIAKARKLKSEDEQLKSKMYVSDLLWGGAAGESQASKIVKQMDDADDKKTARLLVAALHLASDNEPTNPDLWEKAQELARGERKKLKDKSAPNEGDGFKKWPSAYAVGWAVKVYNELGGGWKKKAGLDDWFQGSKPGEKDDRWGDWVAITPVKKTVGKGEDKKTYEPGDIVGPCGISKDKEWADITDKGEDPLKCMPRQKAHDMPKKERAEIAQEKRKQEKAQGDSKKPVHTPTFKKDSSVYDTREDLLFDYLEDVLESFKAINPIQVVYEGTERIVTYQVDVKSDMFRKSQLIALFEGLKESSLSRDIKFKHLVHGEACFYFDACYDQTAFMKRDAGLAHTQGPSLGAKIVKLEFVIDYLCIYFDDGSHVMVYMYEDDALRLYPELFRKEV
jgi:hypothetical protein